MLDLKGTCNARLESQTILRMRAKLCLETKIKLKLEREREKYVHDVQKKLWEKKPPVEQTLLKKSQK